MVVAQTDPAWNALAEGRTSPRHQQIKHNFKIETFGSAEAADRPTTLRVSCQTRPACEVDNALTALITVSLLTGRLPSGLPLGKSPGLVAQVASDPMIDYHGKWFSRALLTTSFTLLKQ